MIPCPSRQRLLDYLEGRIGTSDGQELEHHVEGCLACREAMAALTAPAGATPVDAVPRRADDSPPVVPGCELTGEVRFGGMGAVYFGTETALRRPVAVKVLQRRFAGHADLVARFEAEAQVCAQLQHPGIVPVYQVGRLPDGRPFYTMKLVKGETLGELLRRRSSPADDLQTFLTYFRGVCEAMGYAHAHNVLHVPPGVLVMSTTGRWATRTRTTCCTAT
jgi:hypothetical protein